MTPQHLADLVDEVGGVTGDRDLAGEGRVLARLTPDDRRLDERHVFLRHLAALKHGVSVSMKTDQPVAPEVAC
ncbi:hypothetical protein VP06_07890 [Methylobacterium aquaticum]|uniref:Uncharacterized protein n=1 Tax=Methylobacterium aquaticum TaxID=270351 RepID=A0A0J6SVP0_9HYPH|nr:hypothetical protein VP06_07890 [Methylobacterium aquaticum]